MPPARNSIDSELTLWHNTPPGTGWTVQLQMHKWFGPFCNSGQAYFSSQGYHYEACDGRGSRIPKWDHCPLDSTGRW